jgi:hypothetical protein
MRPPPNVGLFIGDEELLERLTDEDFLVDGGAGFIRRSHTIAKVQPSHYDVDATNLQPHSKKQQPQGQQLSSNT